MVWEKYENEAKESVEDSELQKLFNFKFRKKLNFNWGKFKVVVSIQSQGFSTFFKKHSNLDLFRATTVKTLSLGHWLTKYIVRQRAEFCWDSRRLRQNREWSKITCFWSLRMMEFSRKVTNNAAQNTATEWPIMLPRKLPQSDQYWQIKATFQFSDFHPWKAILHL